MDVSGEELLAFRKGLNSSLRALRSRDPQAAQVFADELDQVPELVHTEQRPSTYINLLALGRAIQLRMEGSECPGE